MYITIKLPKEMLLIVCEDENSDEIVQLIVKNARTGEGTFGDGKIFISDVERVITVSSGEEKYLGGFDHERKYWQSYE